eukprot:gene21368-11771_t
MAGDITFFGNGTADLNLDAFYDGSVADLLTLLRPFSQATGDFQTLLQKGRPTTNWYTWSFPYVGRAHSVGLYVSRYTAQMWDVVLAQARPGIEICVG